MRWAACICIVLLSGCLQADPPLTLGTTTSVRDSGLLDPLLVAFTAETGIPIRAAVAGTGDIHEKARRGDVDVILTHSPTREAQLVAKGVALDRYVVMTNRFLLVGPADDPALVTDALTAADAFSRIASARATFISRADASGTHDKELDIWRAAGLDVGMFDRAWYKAAASGQAAALRLADERDGYALTDEATFRRLAESGAIPHLVEYAVDDAMLRNEYAVMRLVHGAHEREADSFIAWLAGPNGRTAIERHEIGGQRVFHATGGGA